MQRQVLTEQSLFYGDIDMPKGFEIDQEKLTNDILQSTFNSKEFPFSKTWDMLNTYVRDYIGVEYDLRLINKETWGNIYKPAEMTAPLLNSDPVDLRNSPDFVMLYGVKVKDCNIRIYFDDNRRKNRSEDIKLKDNMFIMFPSTNMYHITNTQKDSLNFVQTITYDYN